MGITHEKILLPPQQWTGNTSESTLREKVLGLTWWSHDMEKLSTSLALCEGNLPVAGGFLFTMDHWYGVSMMLFCILSSRISCWHYNDVIMTTMASQITSLTVVYSTVYLDADQRKHQSSASLAFVWGIHRDRWIPRTNGQLRGKCFHLMTSSWNKLLSRFVTTWRYCNVTVINCTIIGCTVSLMTVILLSVVPRPLNVAIGNSEYLQRHDKIDRRLHYLNLHRIKIMCFFLYTM